jgi:hypothetical protein
VHDLKLFGFDVMLLHQSERIVLPVLLGMVVVREIFQIRPMPPHAVPTEYKQSRAILDLFRLCQPFLKIHRVL